MPFQIVRNDITQMKVDAIVNTADPRPTVGYGVDAGIHRKAGPGLLAERLGIGTIPVGGAAVTRAYGLDAKYVIHAVGPMWQGGTRGEEQLLRSCYDKSLRLAVEKGCKSIAFPLISSGDLGVPKPIALQIALEAFQAFLLEHELLIYLVVFSRDAFTLSERLFRDISSFIDDNYALKKELEQYDAADGSSLRQAKQSRSLDREDMCASYGAAPMSLPCAPAPAARSIAPRSLKDMLRQEDKGFSQRLLELIDRTGKKDPQIYARANVTRQHFSKIRNDPHYKPTKSTALAFAIALELDMDETQDLIGRAGFTLTKSSRSDLIIMYFIQTGNHNIFDINAALFEFDQRLLGG